MPSRSTRSRPPHRLPWPTGPPRPPPRPSLGRRASAGLGAMRGRIGERRARGLGPLERTGKVQLELRERERLRPTRVTDDIERIVALGHFHVRAGVLILLEAEELAGVNGSKSRAHDPVR